MSPKNNAIYLTILVAALGYFVDVYDLQLFNIVSRESISGLGITDEAEIAKYDYLLFLWQMGGMLVGGLIWGILGDLKGRKNILFETVVSSGIDTSTTGIFRICPVYPFVYCSSEI